MPSVSKAQQGMMGADLARAQAGQPTVTGMDPSQLADFAGTPTAGLPEKKKHHKKHGKGGGPGPGMRGAGRQPKPRGGSFY
jgi:hypothetical protein